MIIIDFILEVIGYTTARHVLPLITLGKVRVQSVSSTEAGFNWLGFKRVPDGSLICQSPMAGWLGLIPWVLVVALIVTIA
ncbi:hypothetical protein [Sinorhizobium meliloti]|uniref:hypothetical protein n=1 Tax=Rhizobium meliloti TaxID=382 RepID=UPI000302723E|nr:hypothetical protein [Sinorhizobium meliloti]MDE4601645.1 hypothetical protein [Sinorhizobium meliloti]QQF03147.1 hypothetical protein JFX10_17790 [Sinorhizobium meliloti]UDU18022.1 hypothetical protein LJD24_09850 [Sinorhizobium meliloti]